MPFGFVHVAPPSLVMMAEAPFCAMANQVLRVVAGVARLDEEREPRHAARGPARARRELPGLAAVGRLGHLVGLVEARDEVRGVVRVDDDRVEARVVLLGQRARERERQPAVRRLEDLLVAGDVGHPQRRGRRAADGQHVPEREVRRVGHAVEPGPRLAVVGRLPDRAVAADVEIARARRIDADVPDAEAARAREQRRGHLGRRHVLPDAGRAHRGRERSRGRRPSVPTGSRATVGCLRLAAAADDSASATEPKTWSLFMGWSAARRTPRRASVIARSWRVSRRLLRNSVAQPRGHLAVAERGAL